MALGYTKIDSAKAILKHVLTKHKNLRKPMQTRIQHINQTPSITYTFFSFPSINWKYKYK